jgi:hypothetical protein
MAVTIHGTKHIDVTATIDTDDVEEAKRIFDGTDCTVETCDKTVTFNSACETGSEVDSATWDAEQKWNNLSKSERMEMLTGNGASDDAAYEIAGRTFDNVPNEWQEYF